MAIQNRRGNYSDFDPSKMVEGEFAVVKSGDPNTDDGTSVYISTATGTAKRIALYQDIVQEVQGATQEIAEELTTEINEGVAENVTAAQTAATNAQTASETATQKAQAASESAEQAAETVQNIIDNTLTQSGKAADAKKTGDEIAAEAAARTSAINSARLSLEEAILGVSNAVSYEAETREAAITDLKADLTVVQTDVAVIKRVIGIGDLTLEQIHEIVQSGKASEYFAFGDQIMLNYKDGETDYVLPWDIVAFGDFELQDGEAKPGMIVQSHYAMQGVQFSASQAAYVCKTALPAGTYHFTIGTTWGNNCVAGKVYQFTTTKEIPAGGQIVIGTNTSFYIWGAPDVNTANWRAYTFADASSTTPLDDKLALTEGSGGTDLGTLSSATKFGADGMTNLQSAAYGYSRWSHSANRQFYNSAADAGAWWAPQQPEDRPPQQLASAKGFMAGFDEAFLNIIKPVKVTTALNTASDSQIGATEDTYDTFFLPSLEQEYITPQLAGAEGAFWPYWKERLGLTAPQGWYADNANTRHIRYAYNVKTSAQLCRLRSAFRGYAGTTWIVYSTGHVNSYSSASAARGCPACVII